MANEPSKIYGALVQAMTEIGAITKDHKNEFQNYNFRGIDDVYKAVQPTFIKCGIVVVPQVLKSKQEERKTKKGETLIYTILTMRFAFYSAEDDSRVDAITVGEAMDMSDKSSNKAMSAAYKYAIFQTLAVPTESIDSEIDSHTPLPKQATPPHGDNGTKPPKSPEKSKGNETGVNVKKLSTTKLRTPAQRVGLVAEGQKVGLDAEDMKQVIDWILDQKKWNILSEFAADDITRFFPEYYDEYKDYVKEMIKQGSKDA